MTNDYLAKNAASADTFEQAVNTHEEIEDD